MNELAGTSSSPKVMDMATAVSRFVAGGSVVAIEGFTAFICFAAAHEIIRQGKKDLTLVRMTPDLVYDQMVAAGVARKMVFSYLGNPGVGNLHCIRRAVEKGIPQPLELEEYSHFGMVGRYIAGASKLPFFPLRSYTATDLPKANPDIKFLHNPYGEDEIAVVPPINPDVAFLHAQRADAQGNTQLWGLLGMQKEVAFAAKKVVIVVEEIVAEDIIRRDPNRTLIPGLVVDAVVVEPYGAHPSYVQGYYDRDNTAYLEWDKMSRDQASTEAWLQEWVYGVPDRGVYLEKLGKERLATLAPGELWADGVNYGRYA
ncbi:MAG: CoA transferase subunit A [Chloroflexi bacterium]|nr:CoA transferase subunit A [Ardenticatenaceae bacterium]MBL1129824.1 CoA transferase subunit A [Chloroflexota bacterium]NOG35908.1 CoA transferase subunit A [Chloroflexota bacterium]